MCLPNASTTLWKWKAEELMLSAKRYAFVGVTFRAYVTNAMPRYTRLHGHIAEKHTSSVSKSDSSDG